MKGLKNSTAGINRQSVNPLGWKQSRRVLPADCMTTAGAGQAVPVLAMPLLRQDRANGAINIKIEMMETRELLANGVKARMSAYCVPWLAFERFEGSRDQFDRSYMGQPQIEGGSVIPFFNFAALGAPGADPIYHKLGLHGLEDDQVETSYVEAYNAIFNFRARNRSRGITLRDNDDTSLAPAFWDMGRFSHVVPTFDQSSIDGEVALNVVNSRLPVSGLAMSTAATYGGTGAGLVESDGTTAPAGDWTNSSANALWIKESDDDPSVPAIFSEMAENGITVSLSNIEMAKKMQAFAKLRERFTGLADDAADEYIIDMLMSGLQIPDQFLKQPILLSQKMVNFAQAKRYASDSGNLAESAVSGMAQATLSLRVPTLQTGGVIMVIVECFPDQLFERQQDPLWHIKASVDGVPGGQAQTYCLPEAVRDFLDPEKVDYVRNREVDALHSTGAGNFGFAPKNWKWNVAGPRIGGDFHSQTASAASRQRFWAAETTDPVLGEDFYLVPPDLQVGVFLDEEIDPFQIGTGGQVAITGNTQFGPILIEAGENYDEIASQMDNTRIDMEAE